MEPEIAKTFLFLTFFTDEYQADGCLGASCGAKAQKEVVFYTWLLCTDVFLTKWLNMSFEHITDLPTSWVVSSPFHRGEPVTDMTHVSGSPQVHK